MGGVVVLNFQMRGAGHDWDSLGQTSEGAGLALVQWTPHAQVRASIHDYRFGLIEAARVSHSLLAFGSIDRVLGAGAGAGY